MCGNSSALCWKISAFRNMKEQKEQAQRKRKKYLEVLSLICSTVGLNIIIACFCGLTDSFGFKSPDMIFQCAFALLFASILLGIVAMISSVTGYEFFQATSLATSSYSLPSRPLDSSRHKSIQEPVISCRFEDKSTTAEASVTSEQNSSLKCLDDQLRVQPQDCGIVPEKSRQNALPSERQDASSETKAYLGVCRSTSETCTKDPKGDATSIISEPEKNEIVLCTASEVNQSNRITPKGYLYNGFQPSKTSLQDHILSAKASRQSYTLPSSKWNMQSEGKAILQLKKRPNAFLYSQSFTTDSSCGFTKASRMISCDIERDDGKARVTLMAQDCLVAEVSTNKEPFQIQVNPGEIASRCFPGKIDPYEVRNAYFEAGRNYNFQEGFFSSQDAYQRFPKDSVSDVISKINKMNFSS